MRSKNSILVLLLLILNCFYSKAQGAFNACGSEILKEISLKLNPEIQNNNAILEKKYQDDFSKSYRSGNDSVCLPIIVHLIHNGGIENITDTQIFQGIENLNDAFANKNYYNPNTGLDTKIQFCLAQRDTEENEINGIIRYTSIYTDMSISGSLDSILNLAFFDPSQYINLHIVQEACLSGNCGAVGFAGFNKIVVEAAYFGVSESKDAVVTHEMGHFLGLDHTFKGGCINTNCLTDGDKVCDTPPDNQNFENCFSDHNSCTSDAYDTSTNNPFRPIALGGLGDQNDSHRNYMDYNTFECYDQFTQGQVDRMHWTIQNRYSSLLESKACLSPCINEAIALFTTLTDSIEAGTILNFSNLSTNAISYVWTIDGDVFSGIENPTLMFNEAGTYLIELEVWNGDDTCLPHIFSVDIFVYCPIQSCIDYQVIGQYLFFENCVSNLEANTWVILDGNYDTLFQSFSSSLDSFDISNISFIQLCLANNNDFCQDQICAFIDIVSDGSEICNNEKDDDGDGLVDLFDPDCPCNPETYQAQCEIECQYVPDPSFDFGMEIKWKTQPFPGFLSNVVSYSNAINQTILGFTHRPSNNSDGPTLWKLDGMTGSILDETPAPPDGSEWLAVARENPSSEVNYFAFDRYGFQKYNSSLDLILTSDLTSQERTSPINFADFNGDGIAEVYIGNTIYNATTGKILLEDALVKGCSKGCRTQISIAGDFLPSPGLELAIGNVIYDIDINNPNGTSGNSMVAQFADFPVKDGLTSAGDIDGDGQLDVIVVKGTGGPTGDGIWVWNPRTLDMIASAPAGNTWGGIGVIGDVDGDCLPEICMPFFEELRMYKYDGTKNLSLLYKLPTTDNSGSSGVTMFDFNHDGNNEVVYRDLSDLKIIEGSTGVTLSSIPIKSTTGYECPVITDVDNDGQAEILISGHESQWNRDILYCIKSSSGTWAPSRVVWNQYSYNPTFVNDDLTIPRNPQNPAKPLQGTENCLQEACSTPYNNFMLQATYRTQAGCLVWPAIDLSLELLDYTCIGDSLEIDFVINNEADLRSINSTICIDWYFDQMVPSNLLETSCIPINLSSESSSDTLRITVDRHNATHIIANITNLIGGDMQECNYLNNIDTIDIDLSVPSLDLGPDIIKCGSEVISFNVGAGYTSYLWNDLTTDSIYSTSLEGSHFVELTDKCGYFLRDTIEIIFDTIGDIDLGLDLELCAQDSVMIEIADNYDFIHWYPSDKVSCDTCFSIIISSSDDFELITLVEKGNCVSLDTISVVIRSVEVLEISAQICQGEQYQYLDSIWSQEGIYTYHHPACDTIINVLLSINPLDTSYLERQICSGDSLFFDNSWLKDEGEYSASSMNQNECDSTIYLELSYYQDFSIPDEVWLCPGDSILYNNEWVHSDESYVFDLKSSEGCDSIINLTVHAYDGYSVLDTIRLCPGDSILYNNEWVYSDESYVFDLKSSEGCDSIVNLTVQVYDVYSVLDTIRLCPGDSILYNNTWVKAENEYILLKETVHGCDSIINLIVTELNFYAPVDSVWLCSGDSIMIQGNWIYEDFEYQEALSSSQGCDSIYQSFILFEQLPDEPEINIDCESSLIDLSVIAEDWEIFWSNGDMTPMTQFSGDQQVSVTLTSSNNCVITYELDLPSIPNIEPIPPFEDITLNTFDSIIFDLNLELMEWNISWSPSEIISCDTCSHVSIFPVESTLVHLDLDHSSGCTFEYSFLITLNETASDVYHIPNVFSPNDDNQNDVWQVFFNKGIDLRLSEGFIYDRWGNQVKSWKNTSDIVWDGKLNGKSVAQGVYIFFLRFIDQNGEEIEVYGDLTLLR